MYDTSLPSWIEISDQGSQLVISVHGRQQTKIPVVNGINRARERAEAYAAGFIAGMLFDPKTALERAPRRHPQPEAQKVPLVYHGSLSVPGMRAPVHLGAEVVAYLTLRGSSTGYDLTSIDGVLSAGGPLRDVLEALERHLLDQGDPRVRKHWTLPESQREGA